MFEKPAMSSSPKDLMNPPVQFLRVAAATARASKEHPITTDTNGLVYETGTNSVL